MAQPQSNTARIIAFPPRPEPDGMARLRAALTRLQAALDEQKTEVAAWRRAMIELRVSVQRLGGSLSTYQRQLGALQTGVGELHQSSRRLASRAEQMGAEAGSVSQSGAPASA